MFESILFKVKEKGYTPNLNPPDFFNDLKLDYIVDNLAKDYEYVKPFFYYSLKKVENIEYRQDIVKDLEDEEVFKALEDFADSIESMKEDLEKLKRFSCKHQKNILFLDVSISYFESIIKLRKFFERKKPRSEGLARFFSYLNFYIESDHFKEMFEKSEKIKEKLDKIVYLIHIKENRVRVSKYTGEENYVEQVLSTFDRFRQDGEVEDIDIEIHRMDYLNHVEEEILRSVAKLYKNEFEDLSVYCEIYRSFEDDIISRFGIEIRFYLLYLKYIRELKKIGLNFCYPKVKEEKKICVKDGFDMALAYKLAEDKKRVVCNDFCLEKDEQIILVTGPNQGGKTTFARFFGQVHFLASLGLKIPGNHAELLLFDNIFTHFEREEDTETLKSKLEDDLIRAKYIVDRATSKSIIIMNEVFSSTSFEDALFLSKQVLKSVLEKGSVGVFVTFIYELGSLSNKIVSMVSLTDKEDKTRRTYKIVRKDSEGVAYALSLAEKYCLTRHCLEKRLLSKKVTK